MLQHLPSSKFPSQNSKSVHGYIICVLIIAFGQIEEQTLKYVTEDDRRHSMQHRYKIVTDSQLYKNQPRKLKHGAEQIRRAIKMRLKGHI